MDHRSIRELPTYQDHYRPSETPPICYGHLQPIMAPLHGNGDLHELSALARRITSLLWHHRLIRGTTGLSGPRHHRPIGSGEPQAYRVRGTTGLSGPGHHRPIGSRAPQVYRVRGYRRLNEGTVYLHMRASPTIRDGSTIIRGTTKLSEAPPVYQGHYRPVADTAGHKLMIPIKLD